MLGRSAVPRRGGFRPENLGQNAMAVIGKVCSSMFVIGVLVLTILAATYELEDTLFHPSTQISTFFSFKSDNAVIKTEDDSAFGPFVNMTDFDSTVGDAAAPECDPNAPIDCRDPEVFHMMMMATIDKFKDIHFYRFGKPVRGSDDKNCDMAWRFGPKDGKVTTFNKDYRRFGISRSRNCTVSVLSIGEYHSGLNARKRKKNPKAGQRGKQDQVLSFAEENLNDDVPALKSEGSFSHGKYLIYIGGGDRCKSMNHYLWSFLCALGEAQYLNRTLVVDLSICLSSIYTSSKQDEEGKDFRFYFDFEHLKEVASVIEQNQFWSEWTEWQNNDKLHFVEDFRVTPMKLAKVKDTVIMRKFGFVEPDNYWYRVCEGEAESVVRRPWNLIWKSSQLMDVVSAISSKLNSDYDSVHIVRGEKARNKDLWPNLDADTSPKKLVSTLREKIKDGRNLYIATNEADVSFFDPLRDKYRTHFLHEYKDLWDETSNWYSETTKLNKGIPVEFDGYMRTSVDAEMFLRGKKQIETFNDLTNDCKDGVGNCNTASLQPTEFYED